MHARTIARLMVVSSLLGVLAAPQLSAQEGGGARRGRGLFGDWRIHMDFGGRQVDSILSFSRGADGQRSAQWISFFGVSDLKDVTFEEGTLSFVQERQNREGTTVRSTFKGTIADGKLTGTMTGAQGETAVTGERVPRVSRAVGTWNIKFKVGEREISNSLVISPAAEGNVAVDWKSDRVTHQVSDVTYERGTLRFKSHAKLEEREWDSTFEGTISDGVLTGKLTSDRGETAVEGTNAAAAVAGVWNLDLTSERGERKQRLRIDGDLSGLYGAVSIEKAKLEDGKLSFSAPLSFGDQSFSLEFKGSVEGGKLTGELTSERGTTKVTGTKVERPQRQGGRGGRDAAI